MTELREKLNNIVEEVRTKIIPENIKAGVQIFDTEGAFLGDTLDTSDATATAEDIISGKTAYVNGEKVTGSILVSQEPIASGLYTDEEYISAEGLIKPWSFVISFEQQYLFYLTDINIVVRDLNTNVENYISLAENNLDSNFDMISCSIIKDNKIYITLAQTRGSVVGYCLYDLANNTVEKTNTITIDILISKWNRPIIIRYNTIFDKFVFYNAIRTTNGDASTSCLNIIDMTNNTVETYTFGNWGTYAFIDKYDRFIGIWVNSTLVHIWLDGNGNYKTQTKPFSSGVYRNYIYENGLTYAYIPESEAFASATINTTDNTVNLGSTTSVKYPEMLPDTTNLDNKRDMIALNRDIFSQYKNYFNAFGTTDTEYMIACSEEEAIPSGKYAYCTNTCFKDNYLWYFGDSDAGKIYLQGIKFDAMKIKSLQMGEDKLCNTDDATATPEDIVLGKTAYVDGEKVTGTMAENKNNSLIGGDLVGVGSSDITPVCPNFALAIKSISNVVVKNTGVCLFKNIRGLEEITNLVTTGITSTVSMFENCYALKKSPEMDTSSVINMNYMFKMKTSATNNLTELSHMDTSKVEYMATMFEGCINLTDESLNIILDMCRNSKVTFSNRTLKYIGLTQEQATRCQSLSNYQAFLDAGWTTGY